MKILKSVWYQSFLSRIFGTLLCACCLFAPAIISAADGDVDTTFKTDVTENNGTINTVVVQPDGKILVGGFFEAFGGRARRGLARLNADGTLDLTFDAGAAIPNARAAQATVRAIVLQPDGKILVGISYQSPGATPRKLIVRLHPNGTLDLSFNTSLFTRPFETEGAFAIALQADGKIIVGGNFRYTSGTQRNLARLNADGSIDSSFIQPTTGIGANNVRAIAVQPDGKILCGGTGFNGSSIATTRQAFWRLNTDGTVDTGYSDPSIPSSGNINALVLQPDGSMIAVGGANFSGQTPQIMRITAGGTRDASFTDIFSAASLVQLARQTDGKIIVVGDFQITNPAIRNGITRLNTDGTLDTSFSTSGSTGSLRSISAVGLQTNGKAVPVGRFDNFNGSPAEDYLRLNTDGSRDSSFVSNSVGYYGRVYAFLRQPDGKLLVGIGGDSANETKVNGVRINGIVRLNQDYSVDATFASPLTAASSVLHLALQADGKILISGNLYPFGANTLLRLNPNGTVDATFNPPPNLKIPVVQTDGRIIAFGAGEVLRLNSNGSRDNTFTAIVSSNFVNALALQPDGRILVGGIFANINNMPRNNIARLNTDGSVDMSFDPGAGANNSINTLLLRADGRVFLGGRFTSFNGTARNGLALLEANGGLNASFVPANPSSLEVLALALQTDGKLLYGGLLLPAGSSGVYRLNTDGTLDASFSLGAGFNQMYVYAILPQANGKIVVGGIFDSYNDVPRMSLVRLNPRTIADFDGDGKSDLSIFRPPVGQWWFQQSSNGAVPAYTFGTSTDKITPGDYDGDGKTDVAFFRPSTSEWFVLRSSNLTFFAAPFGTSTDIPAPADFDGDAKTDLAVYRASIGTWFILKSSGGVQTTPFGTSGDIPQPSDYDGDGKADVCIFRPIGGSGNAEWWMLRSSNNSTFATPFGIATDKPVPGDYTGDGKSDFAFWRPSTGEWFILRSEDLSFFAAPFGVSTDTPAPGDYDGDGKFDQTVFRSSIATWFILKSNGGTSIQQFGVTGDRPIPNAYVP
jgi:uncharacterized delta-60 repeat protein